MSNRNHLVLLLLVVAGFGCYLLWGEGAPEVGRGSDGSKSRGAGDHRESASNGKGERQGDTREPLRSPGAARPGVQAGDESVGATVPSRVIRGRVVSVAGRALAGVGVAVRIRPAGAMNAQRNWMQLPASSGIALAISGATGEFEFETRVVAGTLTPTGRFVALREARFGPSEQRDTVHLLVVGRTVDLAGRVQSTKGGWASDVNIAVMPAPSVDLPGATGRNHEIAGWMAKTDGEGRFRLSRVPVRSGGLHFFEHGQGEADVVVPQEDTRGMVVILRTEATEYVIRGVVFDHTGKPAPDAWVGSTGDYADCDDQGRFEIHFLASSERSLSDRIEAGMPGVQGTVLNGMRDRLRRATRGVVDVNLKLGRSTLQIRGRVFGADGSPLSGIAVYPFDSEALNPDGMVNNQSASIEDLSVARTGRKLGKGFVWTRVFATTDVAGSFVLRGLQDRDYRLRLFEGKKGVAMTSKPIRAGSHGVVIRVDTAGPRVAGRLIDGAGVPVTGVRVIGEVPYMRLGNRVEYFEMSFGDSDAGGRFHATAFALIPTRLRVEHPDYLPISVAVDPETRTQEVLVFRRCPFRVESKAAAHGFRLLDSKDRRLPLYAFDAGGHEILEFARLQNGRSPVLCASVEVRTLVLLNEQEREIERRPVRVHPGRTTVLR